MDSFFEQIFCDLNESFSVIIEDDERVCYAYLMEGENIIGDVWLYNVLTTPDKTDWSSREDMPFLNPKEYVDSDRTIEPIENSEELNVSWNLNDEQELNEVSIYIRNTLVAKIKPGTKPGWSILASKDGPLAKTLN